ncbi:D-alanyl-D-alanine carboxypeptidase [Anaerobacillus alkaliphilus]|uniref:D-alanyl-D-alanine carboxypeptidase n=1 Tax=Anaerobacillus alkaliphilus TaxID=1548597 RepID=A0A4Q0VUD5_9BACI|nr:serine hydrolase [Anaerobacillus alkaliphilus]RXJ02297.1 D-alanyl-D-alanine carboxypeptidase [Anaerobacillus alkaliphilus]
MNSKKIMVISLLSMMLSFLMISDTSAMGLTTFKKEPTVFFDGDKEVLIENALVDRDHQHIYIPFDHLLLSNTSKADIFRISSIRWEPIFQEELFTFDEEIYSKAAVVIEDASKNIMFGKNVDEHLFPASTTKIMTALIALERGNLDDLVRVGVEAEEVPWDSSKAHIKPGDILTLEQLLYGMMIPSGNDAAAAIAVHIAGSVEAFVSLMNEKAKELGAINTNFKNPHGYHDKEQYTTAIDLATIAQEAWEYDFFQKLVGAERYEAYFTDIEGTEIKRTWRATNQQLIPRSPFYSEVVSGGKTGYTSASRHTLVSFAKHLGHDYITVILRGERDGRYLDTVQLMSRAKEIRQDYYDKNKLTALKKQQLITLNGHQVKVSSFEYQNKTYVAVDEIVHYMNASKYQIFQKQMANVLLERAFLPNKAFFKNNKRLSGPFYSPLLEFYVTTEKEGFSLIGRSNPRGR